MKKTAEFFFDVGSPAAYLAWTQLPGLCAEKGAELVYRPMLLGGVFQATKNSSPAMVPTKARYLIADYARFAHRYGVELVMNPDFPINTLTLMRAVIGVQIKEPLRLETFIACTFRALWIEGQNLGNSKVLAAVVLNAGFEPEKIAAYVGDPEVTTLLKHNTDDAVARGVFGAPTIFVGKEMFFGQDRLDFIREALN